MKNNKIFIKLIALLTIISIIILFNCNMPIDDYHNNDKNNNENNFQNTKKVYLDEYNRLIVDGKPFFPIGLYGVKTGDLKKVADYGFNFVIEDINEVRPFLSDRNYGISELEYLDEVNKYGLKSWLLLTELKKLENGTLSWSDYEKEINMMMRDTIFFNIFILNSINQKIKNIDPGHPTVLSNYISVMTYGLINLYTQITDIYMMNIYPIHLDPSLGTASWVGTSIDLAKEKTGSQAIWTTLQGYGNIDHENRKDKFPTREEIRYMTYLAIAHGSQGIFFFRWVSDPGDQTAQNQALHDEIIKLGGELNYLSPVLLSTSTIYNATLSDNPDIEIMIKKYEDKSYIFALYKNENLPENALVNVKFNVSWANLSIKALFRNKEIKSNPDGFSDEFRKYSVHIYEVIDN